MLMLKAYTTSIMWGMGYLLGLFILLGGAPPAVPIVAIVITAFSMPTISIVHNVEPQWFVPIFMVELILLGLSLSLGSILTAVMAGCFSIASLILAKDLV